MTATTAARLTLPLEPGIPRPAAMQIAATEYERYVDQLRTTVRLLGRLTEDDLAEPARSSLLDAFRSGRRA